MAYQVSKIWRPVTPWRVSMEKMTLARSIGTSLVGVPSRAMRPPWTMWSIIDVNAAGAPDISSPMSKPSFIAIRW